MANTQRLKFAHARGARIECNTIPFKEWQITTAPMWREGLTYRIHPDDADLEYGPLSTAMIETVTKLETTVAFNPATAIACALFPELGDEWWELDGDDRLMQFLFLAELLADEGL